MTPYHGTGFILSNKGYAIDDSLKTDMNKQTQVNDNKHGKSRELAGIATIPGMVIAFLPVGLCPACWPVYAGLLSSLGLGFLLDTAWLLPLTVFFLIIALLALAYRARSRRGYAPLCVGIMAVGMILFSKFVINSDIFLYMGLAMLLGSSVWNSWPHKSTDSGSCTKCAHEVLEEKQTSAINAIEGGNTHG